MILLCVWSRYETLSTIERHADTFCGRYYDEEEDDQEIVETKANAQSQSPNIKEQQTEISD